MEKNKENIYKTVILILLILNLFTFYYSNTTHFEVIKNKIYNKIIVDNDTKDIDTDNENNNLRNDKNNKKIIYVSRHDGTIANFNSIAEFLGFNVTALKPEYGYSERPNCYKKDKCKSFVNLICSKYDFIVVSDIIPDSFIYFTNQCEAKVILEITNRFDLLVKSENRPEYYQLFGWAMTENKNLKVVVNNPFETFYACRRKVFIPNYYLIRPIGNAPPELLVSKYDRVHDEIAVIQRTYQDTDIAIPKLEEIKVNYAKLPRKYGGPLVLATYKAVIMLPYQVSIMKMMENFRYGVAMIVPSERLFLELLEDKNYSFAERNLEDVHDGIIKYVEFYHEDFKDLFVYFDKWEDLPKIIKKTNFKKVKERGKKFISEYEKYALDLWAQVLDIIPTKDLIKEEQPMCGNSEFYNYE